MKEHSVHSLMQSYTCLHAIFNQHHEFLYADTICILMSMISIPGGVMCVPASTICIPAGTIGNQISVGDACVNFFKHGSELLSIPKNFLYCDLNSQLQVKCLPYEHLFLSS